MTSATWLVQLQRVRAIAQTGLAYGKDAYDLERYQELQEIAVDLLASLLQAPPEIVRDVYLPEKGYPTPKVDVRAGVFRDDRILLVQEASDGLWTLPGGWADEHDSPAANTVREVEEESGYQVRAERLVAIKDLHLHPYQPRRLERIYKFFFLCGLEGGEASTSLETSAVAWFSLDDLPALSNGRTLAEDIAMLQAHREDPSISCYFD